MAALDQLRAADALRAVRAVRDLPGGDDFRSSYRAYADRLGPAIVMNGLGQALATERAAAGPAADRESPDRQAHAALYENVSQWLCRAGDGVFHGEPDLLAALMAGDQAGYLRAQAEVLAWLTWHKKFCHAELPRRAAGPGEER
jgi:CRISPR-associated protein Cmr5